jgi:hypothetical protein
MNEQEFWRTTPAKLNSLSEVHIRLNNPSSTPKVARTVEEAGIEF